MNENTLITELKEHIQEAIGDSVFPARGNRLVVPQVIAGYLPLKRTEDDFPFIIVRAENGKTEVENTEVEVSIIIGCYSEDMGGYEDCLIIMQKIRKALMTLNGWTLNNKYVLRFPIEYAFVPEQPFPYWQLDMTTHWSIKAVEPTFEV